MKRGPKSENLVKKALQELKEEASSYVIEYHHAKKNGEIDSIGIDFLIFSKCGLCIPLQVKSSEKPFDRHRRKYPHIKALIAAKPDKQGVQKIKEILREKIKKALERAHSVSEDDL